MTRLIQKAYPVDISAIELGKDDYIDNLYACFRFNNPRADSFTPSREVEIVARSGRKIKVSVPPEMKIDLPSDSKVVNTDLFHLEKIGNNRDTMHLLTMRAGWNQTDRDINRMVDMDPEGTFVARLAGKGFDIPAATCSVLPLGKNNTWIGMILVHPEVRRQGIANAMMQYCLKYAIDSGKIINGLDATPMGNTVYGAVGYVNSYRLWRSYYELNEFADTPYDENHVSVVSKQDLDDILRYDASSYLERERIMRDLYADGDGRCFVYRNDDGVVQGYCFTRPGRIRPFTGPFIADTDEIAQNLLIAASRCLLELNAGKSAFIDTPESKFADPGIYEEGVFNQTRKPCSHRLIKSIVPVRDFTRMYQLVDYSGVEKLVRKFMQTEKLDKHSSRVREFESTMARSVNNYTETLGFMTLEREVLQRKLWGITGPEKG